MRLFGRVFGGIGDGRDARRYVVALLSVASGRRSVSAVAPPS